MTSATPTAREFAHLPSRIRNRWNERLAHQLSEPGTAEEAVVAIVEALRGLEAAETGQE